MGIITDFFEILITSNNKNLDLISKKIEETSKKTAALKDLQDHTYTLQKQLIENQNKLSSIINTATDAIVVLNLNGEIILWNKAAEKMFQYTIDEMHTYGMAAITSPLDYNIHKERFDFFKTEFLVKNNKNVSVKDKLIQGNAVRKDGTVFPVEISVSSWRNNGDLYFTGIIRDLTEREETLKKIYTLESVNALIIKNAPDGIVVYDLNLNVLSWNPAMEQITTVKKEEVLGKNIYTTFPGLLHSDIVDVFKLALSGKENRGPLMLYTDREGNSKYIKGTFSPLYDEKSDKIIGVVELLRIYPEEEVRTPHLVDKMDWTGKTPKK